MKGKRVLVVPVACLLVMGAVGGCWYTPWEAPFRDAPRPRPAPRPQEFPIDRPTYTAPPTMGHCPVVVMETSEGTIRIELWPDNAPQTVANFLRYVDEGFYDGTIFHRVIDGFVIQGGGLAEDMSEKPTHRPIKNEASAELHNYTGTIAMARTHAAHSATSQFFINVANNTFLDHRDETPEGFGYAVFGRVVEGMDVVDRIRSAPTGRCGYYEDVPLTPVVILSVRRAEER